MSIDVFKLVKYSDGEGITHGDLNDVSNFLSASLLDQILGGLAGSVGLTVKDYDLGSNGITPPAHLAYCLNAGTGFPYLGSAANKVKMMPGTLLQVSGTADGNAPKFLAYTFTGTEEFTIAAGDATNPRVDLLQMKLELVDADPQTRDFENAITRVVTTTSMNKKRRVQCTISVKSGVPAASPVYPDPDVGYVAVGGMVVGAGYLTTTQWVLGDDTAGANAVLHDQRMPLCVQGYRVPALNYHLNTAFTAAQPAYFATSTAAGSMISIPCLFGGSSGRLVGVDVRYSSTVAPTAQLLRQTGADTTLSNLTLPSNAGVTDYTRAYYTFEGQHAPLVGPVVQQSVTNKIGPPIWTNGRRCMIQKQFLGVAAGDKVMLRLTSISSGGLVGDTVWYVARGL